MTNHPQANVIPGGEKMESDAQAKVEKNIPSNSIFAGDPAF